MNIPKIKDEVYQLGIYKAKKSWTNTQLAASMTAFGGDWRESFLSKLFAGKTSATEYHRDFIKAYLLSQYMCETIS